MLKDKHGHEFYLLGTNHGESYDSLPENLKKIAQSIKTLVIESEQENYDDNGIPESLVIIGKNKEKSKFKKLSPKAQKKLFDKFGNGVYLYEPWLLFFQYMRNGADEIYPEVTKGMDVGLEEIITQNAGNIVGLENQAEVVKAIDFPSLTLEKISSGIEEGITVDEFDKEADNMLTKAYASGDACAVQSIQDGGEAISLQDPDNHVMFSATSAKKRNTNWLNKILQYTLDNQNKKPMLIAVGVAHVLGECGLLDLLSRNGFTYERILEHDFFKKQAFHTAYLCLNFTSLSFSETSLIIDYLINPTETSKQAEWQISVNEPSTLWAFNMLSSSKKKGLKIDIDFSDKNSQADLWRMGTSACVS